MVMHDRYIRDGNAIVLYGAAVGAIIFIVRNYFNHGKHLPGPRSLPYIGNMFQLPANPLPQLEKWKHEFGDIYQIKLLGANIVVVSGENEMHEMFVVKSTHFAGRPFLYRFMQIAGGGVVTSSYSPKWVLQKKALLNGLKMYGERLLTLEAITQEVVQGLVDKLDQLDGQPIDIHPYLHHAVADIMASIVCNLPVYIPS